MKKERITNQVKSSHTDYNSDIENSKRSRNNQSKDSDQYVEMEGYLGMDDLDKIRRRKLK